MAQKAQKQTAQKQQSIARFFGGGSTKTEQTIDSLLKVQTIDSPKDTQKRKEDDDEDMIATKGLRKKVKLEEGAEQEVGKEREGSVKLEDTEDVEESKVEKVVIEKSVKIELPAPESPVKLASQVSPVKLASQVSPVKLASQAESQPKKTSDPILYSTLTAILDKIESESSRLKITAIISTFFEEILHTNPTKLTHIVYLFINRLGPDYEQNLELGLGETLLIKAISECYGRPTSTIKKEYKELGDLGMVAQKSRSGQRPMFKPAPLDVDTVFQNLTTIAKSTGKDSQLRKIAIINRMLTACDGKTSEAKFLIRSLEGKLRIGLAEKSVLVGIAEGFVKYEHGKENKKQINPDKFVLAADITKEAFSRIPNYLVIISKASEFGIFNLLEHCQLTPGIPLKPMLAKPTKSITEVLDRFQGEEFTCEYKYDGERAQIHLLEDGTIKIYSRNSEDMSQRYPDLILTINDFLQNEGTPLVMDCEVVAWDIQKNKILPFQVLSTRKRKEVDAKDITVQICVFAFDLLYYGDSLLTQPLRERRKIMQEKLSPIEGKFQFATAKNLSNLEELQTFLDESVKDLCEGLMVKMLNGKDSYYEPSKRSRNWLKLKKDYLAGVGDSLDLVVIGGYYGKGKRTGGYGGFLLASYNSDTGEYESTCKIGTGFSDEDLQTIYAKLLPTEIAVPKSYIVYDNSAKPDVWFEPSTLFEVLVADLSLSPIYKAAHGVYTRGILLRFPRFIRLRDDKGIEDGTTSDEIAEFYERQASVN